MLEIAVKVAGAVIFGMTLGLVIGVLVSHWRSR
jgi:hypothetical protein